MNIIGIDFTSAPRKKKPITCARGWFKHNRLTIKQIEHAESFELFNTWLHEPGPWMMAIDFPFSLPHDFLNAIQWPTPWGSVIQKMESMTIQEFENVIRGFKASQPKGKKHRFRPVDKLANAQSPMCMYYTPVGRMLFKGAPYLYRCPASILPMRPRPTNQYIVEGYPALVARSLIGKASYKSDSKSKQTREQEIHRRKIIKGLGSSDIHEKYGFRVDISNLDVNALIDEKGADQLDAILCAVQAAWSHSRHETDWGIPEGEAPLGTWEGWVPDPTLLPNQYAFSPN